MNIKVKLFSLLATSRLSRRTMQIQSTLRLEMDKRLEEKGFSLIELAVTVSVLSILAAIAIPAFSCIIQRAKATSALTALRHIQKQCNIEQLIGATGDAIASNIPGYDFRPQVANPCSSEIKELAFISDDENYLPSYIYSTLANVITYRFAGKTAYDLNNSTQQVCAATPLEAAKKEELKYFSKPCEFVSEYTLSAAEKALPPSFQESALLWSPRVNYARCEEKRQGVALCAGSDWSKEGMVANLKPCTDLCPQSFQGGSRAWYDRHCVNDRYGLPDWIAKGTDAQLQMMGFKNADDYTKYLITNGNAQR